MINTDILADLKDEEYYKEPDWDKLNENMKRKLREGRRPTPIDIKKPTNIIKVTPTGESIVINDESRKLKKRLQNSYRINRQLRKIVLIQLIVILVLIIICSICIVFLNKGNVQDTSKKSMESSSISKDSAYNGKHTQGSAIADDDTSDHADDSTQSDSICLLYTSDADDEL